MATFTKCCLDLKTDFSTVAAGLFVPLLGEESLFKGRIPKAKLNSHDG